MPDEPDDEPRNDADEITLEEWIASTQSCCGVEPDRDRKTPPAG